MAGKKYYSKFSPDWLKNPKYKKWLRSVDSSDTMAFCKICNTQFDVGSMRIGAIVSHSAGSKHKARSAPANSNVTSVLTFLSSARTSTPSSSTTTPSSSTTTTPSSSSTNDPADSNVIKILIINWIWLFFEYFLNKNCYKIYSYHKTAVHRLII